MRRPLLLLALAGLNACTNAGPLDVPPVDVPGVPGDPLPDGDFEGVDVHGVATTLRLSDLSEANTRHAVIVVSGGLWCGTCQWLGAPLETIVGAETAARLTRIDLVLGDRDNGVPTREAARAWQALGTNAPAGADPNHQLVALVPDRSPLPLILVVDTQNLTVVDSMANPTTTELREKLAHHVGTTATASVLTDGFDENEWALLQTIALPGSPPPSPENPVADDPAAVALGEALFFDTGLSPQGIACASCHRPEHHLQNDTPVGEGAALGRRRVPSVTLAAHARWQLWDGRAATLAEQSLLPMEDETEMASSRTYVARHVIGEHRVAYEKVFGPAPDVSHWPPEGKPGDAAFDILAAGDRDTITEVFERAGQAIAAWERSLRVAPNALDAYLAGDVHVLDTEQTYGLRLFVKQACQQCHWGPRLTDDAFHNVGFPGRADDPDAGRFDVFDPGAAPRYRGQFKTPPLRGVAHGSFFGHAGRHADLSEVMQTYGWRTQDEDAVVGEREPWLPPFGETAQWGLLPFLGMLTAERVEP